MLFKERKIIIFQEHFPSTEKKKNPSKSLCSSQNTELVTRSGYLPEEKFNQTGIKGILPLSLSLSLIARHCFSERLIKVRKYGLEGREREFGRALPPFELMTGDTVRVPGLEGGEGSCGIAAENRRSIVPAVNKSLMIPRQALPRPPRRPTTTNYTKRRDDGGIL